MPAEAATPDPLRATESWFVKHGLPYFVPSERAAARRALHPRRTVPLLVLTVVVSVGVAALLIHWSGDRSFGPGTLVFVGLTAAFGYAVTALGARPILVWAVTTTVGGLRHLLPMMARSLPLLVVFVLFLFINAEVWHVAANLDGAVLWLVVVLFLGLGTAFFVMRLPVEIDRADDELDDERIGAVTRGTPVGGEVAAVAVARPGLLTAETELTRFERTNLMLALVVVQLSQVLLVALSLMLFLIGFGAIAMKREVVEAWIGEGTTHLPGVENLSVELVQVAVFLAAFSAFYISVTAVTDDAYRGAFFTGVMQELERSIAVRAAYNAVRRSRGAARDDDPTVRLPAPDGERPGSPPAAR
jgi:hypothetical protein